MKIPNLTTIALEGPDKVGKATQSKLLLVALEVMGFSRSEHSSLRKHGCLLIEVPSKNHACYDKIYDMLRRREDGSAPAHDHPGVFQAFQTANRFHVQDDLRRLSAERNMVVVFDRWQASSRVYGRIAGLSERELEDIAEGLLVPDITIILDGGGFDRPEQADDAYEDDDSLQSKSQQLYADQLSGGADVGLVYHVDADRSRNIVHQQILSSVTRVLVARGLL